MVQAPIEGKEGVCVCVWQGDMSKSEKSAQEYKCFFATFAES